VWQKEIEAREGDLSILEGVEMFQLRDEALKRRKENSIMSKEIVRENQRIYRRSRVDNQKNKIVLEWQDYWKHVQDSILKKVTHATKQWIRNYPNAMLKKRKELERAFFMPQLDLNLDRKKELSSIFHISMLLLDGKMASCALLPEELVFHIEKKFKGQSISLDALELEISIKLKMKLEISLREVYDDMEQHDVDFVLSYLREKFKQFDGTRWKYYISSIHNVMLFHDCFENKVSHEKIYYIA